MMTEYVQKMIIGEGLNKDRMETEEDQWGDSE